MSGRRIAKNALLLWARMALAVIIGLYTSRIVLQTLGVQDYGIYAVVGSVVAFLSFLNTSMAGATSRFITIELGKNNRQRLNETFSSAMTLHIAIALFVLVIAETVGLWFLNNHLVIPTDRLAAANWVYQMTIASTLLTITQAPYNACVMAHEKMSIYAYIEIINVLLRLAIVYLLIIGNADKLILYGALSLTVSTFILILYRLYCRKKFTEAHFKWQWNAAIIKPMIQFCGWDIYGNGCVTARQEGTIVMINTFFGPLLNAAANVATIVERTVTGLAMNILHAMRPQIVKQYAKGDITRIENLMIQASRSSIIIIAIMIIPMILEMDHILKLWLGNDLPPFAVTFTILMLINGLLSVIINVINSAIIATGNIKPISIYSGSIFLLNLAVLYAALHLGCDANWIYSLYAIFSAMVLTTNIIILHNLIEKINILRLTLKGIISPLFVAIMAAIICLCIKNLSLFCSTIAEIIAIAITSTTTLIAASYFALLNRSEKIALRGFFRF